MRSRLRFAIIGVAISAAVLFGVSALHSSSPAEASQAQPAAHAAVHFKEIPFYWRTFRNWDGSLCVGLYSDNGQPTPIYYCYN